MNQYAALETVLLYEDQSMLEQLKKKIINAENFSKSGIDIGYDVIWFLACIDRFRQRDDFILQPIRELQKTLNWIETRLMCSCASVLFDNG